MHVIYLSLALSVSLFIQHTGSITIIPFFVFLMLAASGEKTKIPMMQVWLVTILIAACLSPVSQNSYVVTGWLIAMCVVALTASRASTIACFIIIGIFSVNLIAQKLLWPDYLFNFPRRASWPIYNPSGAAALINLALLPVIAWADRNRNVLSILSVIILLAGLIVTESKGGILSFSIGLAFYLSVTRPKLIPVFVTTLIGVIGFVLSTRQGINSLSERLPIIEASLPLISWQGSGIGTYLDLYSQIRTETVQSGMFAHNDLLQISIEMGIPCAIIFLTMIICAMLKTNKINAGYAAALLAVTTHSMVSFCFYLPAISIMTGVAFNRIYGEQDGR